MRLGISLEKRTSLKAEVVTYDGLIGTVFIKYSILYLIKELFKIVLK